MATQEYIDDLIIVIETAEDAESVTNQWWRRFLAS